MPIDELINQAQANNTAAFEELLLLYQDRVYTHCFHLANNPHDAQDLAQDVFIQAYRNIRSFRKDADFGTWLHKIAVNLWINNRRRNKKIIAFSLDEPVATGDGEVIRELAANEDSPLDKVEQIEFSEMVNRALNQLIPEFKTVLVLREFEGYSYEEIAGILDCSPGTVKSRINRGRKALKKELEQLELR
jgi:RNA polymerase sigma-70 factor (ECF subfamily)